MVRKTAVIKSLNREYEMPGSQLLVLYGHYGCDKECYIRHFLKGKEYFYYRARELPAAEQSRRLFAELAKRCGQPSDTAVWEDCLTQLCGGSEKPVIVIDEFEYMLKKGSDFPEKILQVKKEAAGAGVLILLCSSSLVFVEQKMAQILGRAFYEIDSTYKITELTFLDVVRTFGDKTVSECVEIYGAAGGVPAYLALWDAGKSTKENICRLMLSPQGGLFSEAERALRTQLRELSVYHTVLEAMAGGCQSLNEIHRRTGFSRAKVSVYLKNLMELEIAEKVVSLETGGKESAKKGVYRIRHAFLRFWFRFVFPHLSDLYLYTPEQFYERHIAKELGGYLEHTFVLVCMEYLKLMNRLHRLPVEIDKIGTWVGRQGKIDLIAQSADQKSIVGICSWEAEQMPYAAYERLDALMQQAQMDAAGLYFFSGKSFEQEFSEKAAQDPRITLIGMSEL